MSDSLTQLLGGPSAGDHARLAELHSELLRRALAEAALDVTYRTVDSPVGSLLLAATPAGVVRVAFEREDHERVLDWLGATIGPRILQGGDRLDLLAREL